MKKSILGTSKEEYRRKLNIYIAITVAVIVITVALNVVLTLLRTESTHAAFLAVNIIADIAAVWFTIFFVSNVIVIKKRLFSLAERSAAGETFTAEAESVSANTVRVSFFNCFEVVCTDGRKFYCAKNGALCVTAGMKATFTLVENILVEVEDE